MPMVGGSLWVLRLLPLLKLVACHDIAEILLKVALKTRALNQMMERHCINKCKKKQTKLLYAVYKGKCS
jgi:hypothetical protein